VGVAFTFLAFLSVALGSLWFGVRLLRGEDVSGQDGQRRPSGCAGVAFVCFGLGASYASYLLAWEVDPPYFLVLASLAGPLATSVLLFRAVDGGMANAYLMGARRRRQTGGKPRDTKGWGTSAAIAVIQAAFAVEPPEDREAAGYRQAPGSGDYRRALDEGLRTASRRAVRRVVSCWWASLALLVAPTMALAFGWALDDLAWQSLVAGLALGVANLGLSAGVGLQVVNARREVVAVLTTRDLEEATPPDARMTS